jgi:hypothetical protein
MKVRLPTRYIWGFYIVSTTVFLGLQLAGLDFLFLHFEWWEMQIGALIVSVYAVLTARQLYTHRRLWPQKVLPYLCPLSFVHFAADGPFWINAVIFAFNFLFWWVSYRLAGPLAKASPYSGFNGYL